MAYYNDEFNNEDVFEGVPCEFCKRLFPFEDIVMHETGCEYDLVRVTEPIGMEQFASQEIKTETSTNADFPSPEVLREMFSETPVEKEKVAVPKETAPVLKETTSVKKGIPKKEETVKDTFQEYEVLEDHILENETFTFASGKSKEKKVEKEVPSFKKPPIPTMSNSEMRCIFQNILSDSDNEDNESLEKFWQRAEVELAQRLRAWKKKNQTVIS